MLAIRTSLVIAILASCTSSEESHDARKRCVALRDHVIALRLHGVPSQDLAAHRDAMTRAVGDGFIDKCGALDGSQVTCALAAKDFDSAAACTASLSAP